MDLHVLTPSCPTRRSSDLIRDELGERAQREEVNVSGLEIVGNGNRRFPSPPRQTLYRAPYETNLVVEPKRTVNELFHLAGAVPVGHRAKNDAVFRQLPGGRAKGGEGVFQLFKHIAVEEGIR